MVQVLSLNGNPYFEWCAIRHRYNNGHQKDIHLKEITHDGQNQSVILGNILWCMVMAGFENMANVTYVKNIENSNTLYDYDTLNLKP